METQVNDASYPRSLTATPPPAHASAVLRTIRADGRMSRVESARVTGRSEPTVNGAVRLLLDAGYLTERVAGLDARTRRPGPQARLLSFRGDLGHVLGIDIGANKVLVLVADLTGEVLGTVRRRTSAHDRQAADTLLDFEHAAGGTAFARLSLRAAAAGESPVLLELAGGDPDASDAEVVFAAADRGDKAARRILDELLQRLARGIASAVTILNRSTVIVGGGVSRAGERMLEPPERRIAGLVLVPPRVVLSTLGGESVALGPARLARGAVEERLFDVAVSEAV